MGPLEFEFFYRLLSLILLKSYLVVVQLTVSSDCENFIAQSKIGHAFCAGGRGDHSRGGEAFAQWRIVAMAVSRVAVKIPVDIAGTFELACAGFEVADNSTAGGSRQVDAPRTS